MRWILLLFVAYCLLSLSSAGLLQRIQQLGRRQKPVVRTENPSLEANNSTKIVKTQLPSNTTKLETTTTKVPSKPEAQPAETNQQDADEKESCGGSVLLDMKSKKQQTLTSANFPKSRKSPYACSWDVQVSKTCQRGQVSIKFERDSRLPKEDRCAKGYVRITPILQDVKICGNISSIPELKFFTTGEDEKMTILMKSMGLDDGSPEGLSFSIKGECLDDINIKTDLTIVNGQTTSKWLVGAAKKAGVVVFSRSVIQPMAKLSPKVSTELLEWDVANTEAPSTEDTTYVAPIVADSDYLETEANVEPEWNKNPVILSEEVSSSPSPVVQKTTAKPSSSKATKRTTTSTTTTTTEAPTTTTKPPRQYVSLLYVIMRRFGLL